jgi:hypothetical protein
MARANFFPRGKSNGSFVDGDCISTRVQNLISLAHFTKSIAPIFD